jgi:hypothetical protein
VTKLISLNANSLDDDINISNAVLGIESDSDSSPDSPFADKREQDVSGCIRTLLLDFFSYINALMV